MHSDFKPQMKSPSAGTPVTIELLQEDIDKQVKAAPIVLFMKGTPEAPECGFSRAIVQVLNMHGYKFNAINVNRDMMLKEAVKQYSGTLIQVTILTKMLFL